jgi:PKD repeat protein
VGVGEDILPSFYPQALNGAGLDSCDGSEEQFPSNSVSLDNDGDGFTDGADPDCAGNQPPVADPNGPYNGTVGIPVVFDGTGSSDPDGTIVAWDWDFGDGNVGTGETPTHT